MKQFDPDIALQIPERQPTESLRTQCGGFFVGSLGTYMNFQVTKSFSGQSKSSFSTPTALQL